MQINKQITPIKSKNRIQQIGVFNTASRFVATYSSKSKNDPSDHAYHSHSALSTNVYELKNHSPNRRAKFTFFKNGERGSIVLEAAMVLPIFLFISIFLVYLVQMTLVYTAMQNVTSDTARYVATHMYPVQLAADNLVAKKILPAESMRLPKLTFTELASKYQDAVPAPLNTWMMEAASSGDIKLQEMKNQLSAPALDTMIKPLMQKLSAENKLDYERIHVTQVTVPDLTAKTHPYFGIEIRYELPFKIPLIFKPIVLQARATERLWIGDTGEFGEDAAAEATEETGVSVVSVPSPAYPESNISIVAKAPPGTTVHLNIQYKSGNSTAQGLGQATVDAEGNVNWTWKIPSNATPGWANYTITTADGKEVRGVFQVAEYDGRPVIGSAAS